MKNVEIGQKVIVYDRFRFSVCLKATVRSKASNNDGVEVRLSESNNQQYPVGASVWVSSRQLRKDKSP